MPTTTDAERPLIVADTLSAYTFKVAESDDHRTTLQFRFSGRDQGRDGSLVLQLPLTCPDTGTSLASDKHKKVIQEFLSFVLDELARPLAGAPAPALARLSFRDWADARDWEVLINAGLDECATRMFEDWVHEKPDRERAVRRLAYFRQVLLPILRATPLDRTWPQ